jgi:Ca2+/H+ antiporter
VSRHESQIAVDEAQNAAKEVEEDEEEEEEEDEMWHLTDGQLKLKAFLLLAGSVGVVSFFSDPMVDVIGAFGKSINIDAFYISFVVTPIASNASEVIAGLIFAAKKTNEVCGGCRCVFVVCLLHVCCVFVACLLHICALVFTHPLS